MEEHKTYIHELYIEVLICNKNKRTFVSNCKKHDKNSWDVHICQIWEMHIHASYVQFGHLF